MNYIAKYSLAKHARSLLLGNEPYARKKSFPKNNKLDRERPFTFEHPIPANQIRKNTDLKLDSIKKFSKL
jgi:hypothetical protein